MQRVAILNGDNWNYDKDYSLAVSSILTPGVVEGLEITNAGTEEVPVYSMGIGKAFIEVIRTSVTPNEKFYIVFENTEPVIIEGTSGYIFIKVTKENINDPEYNTGEGEGIAEVKIDDNLPGTDYIPLAKVSVETIETEEGTTTQTIIEELRSFIQLKPLGFSGFPASSLGYTGPDGKYTQLDFSETSSVGKTIVVGPGGILQLESPSIDISGLDETISMKKTDYLLVYKTGTGGGNFKIALENFPSDIYGDNSDGDLILETGQTYTLNLQNKVYNFRNLVIPSGATLTFNQVTSNMDSFMVKCKNFTLQGLLDLSLKRRYYQNYTNKVTTFGTISMADGLGGAGGKGGSTNYGGAGGTTSTCYGAGGGGGGQGINGVTKYGGAGSNGQVNGAGYGGYGVSNYYQWTAGVGGTPPGGNGIPANANGVSCGSGCWATGGGGAGGDFGGGGLNLLMNAENVTLAGTINTSGGNGGKGGNGTATLQASGGESGGGGGGGGGASGNQIINYGNLLQNSLTSIRTAGTGGAIGTSGGGQGVNGSPGSSGSTGTLLLNKIS